MHTRLLVGSAPVLKARIRFCGAGLFHRAGQRQSYGLFHLTMTA